MEENQKKEIKRLIQKGFNMELISFELDIPIEQVRQCQKELEIEKKNSNIKTYSVNEIKDKKNHQAHLKMEQIRKKYREIYFKNNIVQVELPKTLSQQELEILESVIAAIEEKIQEIKNSSKIEKRTNVNIILSELKKIEEYQLPIEHAEKLKDLMNSRELLNVNIKRSDTIDYQVSRAKGHIINQFAKAIEAKIYETESVEDLKILEGKITLEMIKCKPILVGAVKTKILNKILTIQQQAAHERIRHDIPVDIISVIRDLANGSIDVKKANDVIDKEARERVTSKLPNKFRLTEQQERRQILIQIRTIIMEKAEEYPIQEPEKVVLQLQELNEGDFGAAIRVVVKNMINRKEFEKAKDFCNKILNEDKSSDTATYIRSLRKEIRNAEIGNIVQTAINLEGNPEQERIYFELIEKGLKMGNVKLSAISLGKTKDGTRDISLADVWIDEEPNINQYK